MLKCQLAPFDGLSIFSFGACPVIVPAIGTDVGAGADEDADADEVARGDEDGGAVVGAGADEGADARGGTDTSLLVVPDW